MSIAITYQGLQYPVPHPPGTCRGCGWSPDQHPWPGGPRWWIAKELCGICQAQALFAAGRTISI